MINTFIFVFICQLETTSKCYFRLKGLVYVTQVANEVIKDHKNIHKLE